MKKYSNKEEFLKLLADKNFLEENEIDILLSTKKIISDELLNDLDVAKVLLKLGVRLDVFSTTIKADKDCAFLGCVRFPQDIEKVDAKFKNDREFIIKFLKTPKHIAGFKYIPNSFKDDDEIVKYALEEDVCNYQYVSPRLKDDKELALSVCAKNGYLFNFVSDKLKKDKDLILLVNDKNGRVSLTNASHKIIDDEDLAKKLLKNDGSNYEYLSDRLKNRKDLIKIALEKKVGKPLFHSFNSIPKDLYRDSEVFDLCFNVSLEMYGSLPEDMKQDENIRKKFNVDKAIVTYSWRHGFYSAKERKEIEKAINEHDYDTFMNYFKNNGAGLKRNGWLYLADECIFLDVVDITIKENFMKIAESESEAG